MTYKYAVEFQAKVLEMKEKSPYLFGNKSGDGGISVSVEEYNTSKFCYITLAVKSHAFHHIDKLLGLLVEPEWFITYHQHDNTINVVLDNYNKMK